MMCVQGLLWLGELAHHTHGVKLHEVKTLAAAVSYTSMQQCHAVIHLTQHLPIARTSSKMTTKNNYSQKMK